MQTILIVDDNTLFRKTLKETLLSRIPTLSIYEANSRDEVLRVLPAAVPDLIFMDIQLSGDSGLELTQIIKRLYPKIKVVVLTSYDLPEYREAAFRQGADHYAAKDSFMLLLDSLFPASVA